MTLFKNFQKKNLAKLYKSFRVLNFTKVSGAIFAILSNSPVLDTTATIHGINWETTPDSKVQTTIDNSKETKTIRNHFGELGIEIEHDQPICYESPFEKEVRKKYLKSILYK